MPTRDRDQVVGLNSTRDADRYRFHDLLRELTVRQGGTRTLRDCGGRDGWPSHGVYFFYEHGELLADGQPRIVPRRHPRSHGDQPRHPVETAQPAPGQPGRRQSRRRQPPRSIFHRHVGTALLNRHHPDSELLNSWLAAKPSDRAAEAALERQVSTVIGSMPFTWLAVPTAESRGWLERNAIGLLARSRPSPDWSGRHASHEAVRTSGLWNVNHINVRYDDGFVDRLSAAAEV